MSINKYAQRIGVSDTSVRKAIARGRITPLDDGSIDPIRADVEWVANANPRKLWPLSPKVMEMMAHSARVGLRRINKLIQEEREQRLMERYKGE